MKQIRNVFGQDQSDSDENVKRMSFSRGQKIMFGILFLFLTLIWFFRPIGMIHGVIMFFYVHPMAVIFPILSAAAITGIAIAIGFWFYKRSSANGKKDRYGSRIEPEPFNKSLFSYRTGYYNRFRLSAYSWIAIASVILMFPMGIVVSNWMNHNATYQHYKDSFSMIENLPAAGKARIMPKEVAMSMSSSGFDSSTHSLGFAHIVRGNGGNLEWSFGQVPGSVFNKMYLQNTSGVYTQNAATTARDSESVKASFERSPGTYFWRSLEWKAYKEHFFTQVAEEVFVVTPEGEPLILAPYLKYEGFLAKVPVLAGIYVLHPDGEMEDLSPEEAAERPEIANSGRLFPETLARDIHESYKYKNGIINRLFAHKDQIDLTDDDSSNSQPYMMDFKGQGTKWVSTAKPWGKSNATKAVFLTDTITGETEIWQTEGDSKLTGPSRALDVVVGLSIPGVLFGDNGSDDDDNASGRFQAVEPRPIIHDGRLQFLVSVIPSNKSGVTKSVIVDAETSKAVAIFNHDTDNDQATKDLIAYMEGKDVQVTPSEITETEPDQVPDSGVEPLPDDPASGNDYQSQKELIEDLIEDNQRQRELLEELRQQMENQQ